MRQWIRSHVTFANVISLAALFVALGGTATAVTYVVSSNSQVGPGTISGDKPPTGKHANIIAGSVNAQDVADNSLGGADINESGLAKVPNADKLDGLDSTAFFPNSKLIRVGPVTSTPSNDSILFPVIAQVGHFTFTGKCLRQDSASDEVSVFISSQVAHSTYGSMTQAAAGGASGDGDMPANGGFDAVADYSFPGGTPNFNPASGTAVAPDGQQVTFDVYQAMNTRGQAHQCIFGGTFVLKP